jgi:hypothetical protein
VAENTPPRPLCSPAARAPSRLGAMCWHAPACRMAIPRPIPIQLGNRHRCMDKMLSHALHVTSKPPLPHYAPSAHARLGMAIRVRVSGHPRVFNPTGAGVILHLCVHPHPTRTESDVGGDSIFTRGCSQNPKIIIILAHWLAQPSLLLSISHVYKPTAT